MNRIHLRLGKREFCPSIIVSLVALLFVATCLRLGFWQLERAEYKRTIETRYQDQLDQPFRDFALDSTVNPDLQFRNIRLRGHYETEKQLLLDNQLHLGRSGYGVLTPFKLSQNKAVLVHRGWVKADPDRSRLPRLITDEVNWVHGVVTLADTSGFRMGKIELGGIWPLVIPYVDIKALQAGYEFELLPYVIRLSQDDPGEYIRDWKPVWSPPEKSEAYAVQWFSFATIAAFLYVFLNLKKLE